jgi:hypothetical protein
VIPEKLRDKSKFDVGLMLDPQTLSDLVTIEEILESGLVKVMEIGSDNLVGIEEILNAARKIFKKERKRPMTSIMWKLQRLAAERPRIRGDDTKIRIINWHTDYYGEIAYFAISNFWRNVASAHLKVRK